MSEKTLYVVTGHLRTSRFTYNCPTAAWALRKMRDFIHADYTDVTATGPDGRPVTESELAALVDDTAAGGAPVDVGANRAPALAG